MFQEGHPRRALFERKGSVLTGDVHPEVADVAGAMTPVPGGVGPLTIAMLMANTLKAAEPTQCRMHRPWRRHVEYVVSGFSRTVITC